MEPNQFLKLIDKEISVAKAVEDLMKKQLDFNLKALSASLDSVLKDSVKEGFTYAIGSHKISDLSDKIRSLERSIKGSALHLQSLDTLKNSFTDKAEEKTIMVSGGFDPIHSGHVKMILDAAKIGSVIVVANSDDWLKRKKGYSFMNWEERKEILQSIQGVKEVVSVDDSDDTVCEAINRVMPDIFANGGDRTSKNTPERSLCEKLKIEVLWGVGGDKIQSSSDLVSNAKSKAKK